MRVLAFTHRRLCVKHAFTLVCFINSHLSSPLTNERSGMWKWNVPWLKVQSDRSEHRAWVESEWERMRARWANGEGVGVAKNEEDENEEENEAEEGEEDGDSSRGGRRSGGGGGRGEGGDGGGGGGIRGEARGRDHKPPPSDRCNNSSSGGGGGRNFVGGGRGANATDGPRMSGLALKPA